jgi:4'-phosphopantetheinyl transferase
MTAVTSRVHGLRPGHVEVWATALDRAPAALERLARHLTGDETARAGRFVFERDRHRFVVARGVLRELLGACLGRPPGEIRFVYGAAGKPALTPPGDAGGLEFTVSHSGELALYAVARHRAVGVDVERVRALDDLEALAARSFSPAERRALMTLPAAQRPEGFFACWTRKEAFIKALGQGLSHPLDAFTVSLTPGEPVRLLDVGGDAASAERWTLAAIDVGEGYHAAVAVEGPATVTMRGYWEQTSGS